MSFSALAQPPADPRREAFEKIMRAASASPQRCVRTLSGGNFITGCTITEGGTSKLRLRYLLTIQDDLGRFRCSVSVLLDGHGNNPALFLCQTGGLARLKRIIEPDLNVPLESIPTDGIGALFVTEFNHALRTLADSLP